VSVALVVVAYLCGAIPSGVLLARTAGVDVRRAGSGNVGATNVARTAGARLGLLTLAADVAKGFAPVAIATRLGGDGALPAWAAVAVVLGHVFPPTLGGGKGVATALGASLALYPAATLPTLGAFGLTLASSRWVSLASMVAALVAPVAVGCLGYPRADLAAAAATALLIVVRHRDNVERILAGTEPKIGLRQKQASPGN
jgi:glycerol-3-phosphate acyltransferase PlsY